MLNFIIVKGAKVHNLKNIDVRIPRDRLVVITGPSGSGKSSLAFDTLYAEGHRRYMESLSSYAGQFLKQMQKPDVDFIEGLSPSIAIEQKTTTKNPRSTLGTITEIYDYLRVLYARIGDRNCYKCGNPMETQDTRQIIDSLVNLPAGSRVQILSPVVMGRKGEYKKELRQIRRQGFIRARIDGEMVDLTTDIKLNRHKRHNIDIVIDRLIIKSGIERRVTEAIGLAMRFTSVVVINIIEKQEDIFFSRKLACPGCGISYPEISPRFFSFNSPYGACPGCRGIGFENMGEESGDMGELRPCSRCKGLRLRKEALGVTVNGMNIGELSNMSIEDAAVFFERLKLGEREQVIAEKVLKEIRERLSFLSKVGVGYLTLNRPAFTLSGGEGQRIRLATQVGSSLTGVLYILDEPSIGLHPHDHGKLLDSLCKLRDMGNTVIVVEHDEDTIRRADHIIDMGPAAGLRGGFVVAEGSPERITGNKNSPTGSYLRGGQTIGLPAKRRRCRGHITVVGAREHNLKNIDVKIPLGVLTCITGVSGSGKSTVVFEILYRALAKKLYSRRGKASSALPEGISLRHRVGRHKEILGIEKIDKVIDIDQSPLGKTPRSNPATYTGIFTFIRSFYSHLPDSRVRGYRPGRFSFNVAGGRCETCKGDGLIKVAMHFLPDIYVPCEVCKGKRYNRETLNIKYKGKNIADILDMTVAQALEFFSPIPALKHKLTALDSVGLGYIQLGQSATMLSGGEAQRVKLSRELGKKATGKTLYILDEPTTGLHFVDIQKLVNVLNGLVEAGNSVVVIEHNLEIIKIADHIIDLGPGGGDEGGRIIAAGTPEEVAMDPGSYTGMFLKRKLPAGEAVA
ncbi:MAG TPA: excinuclease ABC subunit A [Nitrospirae bacterium]|nr:UvrABC system protein A [bacterium BMS3Abin10]GBE37938.1 UvrABC system protein A [bacterium BMS3Bbin08]HDK80965.1 excinuclease ABC subunit A [Nitrospirota bacterium]